MKTAKKMMHANVAFRLWRNVFVFNSFQFSNLKQLKSGTLKESKLAGVLLFKQFNLIV
jgi:hypothetical protein